MIASEYEERFRCPKPSLHQIFAETQGSKRGQRRSLRLWAAAAFVGVMTMTCNVVSHHTIHREAGNGSQVGNEGGRLPWP